MLQSSAPHQVANASVRSSWKPAAAALAACFVLWFPARSRRAFYSKWPRIPLALSLLALGGLSALTLSGCANNHPITGGTPPGAYAVSVTAQTTGAGPVRAHSATITVNVKSLF